MKGVMQESLLPWMLNGTMQAPFLCSGDEAESLLLGHLVASGWVDDAEDVQSIRIENGLWQVQARLCAWASKPLVQHLDVLQPLETGFALPASEIIRCCEQVMELDHGTGLHAVLLCDGEKTALGRDIGRHNALEKAVGSAIRTGLRPERTILAASGRLSLEMLARAAFARVPVLVTKKQVGSLCATYAQRLNIAVCRLGAALEPLTHSERVEE